MDAIFLDFKKAFDKVSHKRLLLKLEALGIGGGGIVELDRVLAG